MSTALAVHGAGLILFVKLHQAHLSVVARSRSNIAIKTSFLVGEIRVAWIEKDLKDQFDE